MKTGDLVALVGVSRHGKNRVREQGHAWTVHHAHPHESRVCLVAVSNPDNWRWVFKGGYDPDFIIKEI